MTTTQALRTRKVIGLDTRGRPRTYRLAPAGSRQAAYRRLMISILRLDVASLVGDLQSRYADAQLAEAA